MERMIVVHLLQLIVLLLPHCASFAKLLHKPHTVPCSQLIVFGDDFSDDGIEIDENSHGFSRNSNGPVWPEYLKKMLGCEEYINYAYSGAKSGYDNMFFTDWSGIMWQIEYHLMNHRIKSPDSLIILQIAGVLELFGHQKNVDESFNDRKIDENMVHAVLALIDNIDDGIIIIMNLVDPTETPGYATIALNNYDDLDISTKIAQINTKLWKLVLTEGRINQRVRLFDLNAAMTDATRKLNTREPFTYQQANLTSRKIYDYAYYDKWYPTTLVHHEIAQKLIKFLEDL